MSRRHTLQQKPRGSNALPTLFHHSQDSDAARSGRWYGSGFHGRVFPPRRWAIFYRSVSRADKAIKRVGDLQRGGRFQHSLGQSSAVYDIQFNTNRSDSYQNVSGLTMLKWLTFAPVVSMKRRNLAAGRQHFPPVGRKNSFHKRMSSVKMPTFACYTRTLLAGKWPILIFAALTVGAMFLPCGIWLRGMLAGFSRCSCSSPFRFPRSRRSVTDPRAIIAADGTIVEISTVHEPYF